MDLLKPLLLEILTPECYDKFFLNLNFLDVLCLKAALSKGLSMGIIAGSFVGKLSLFSQSERNCTSSQNNF